MYCLDKLQRELAYYFSKDIRELPRVQELLTAKGYTQVQKGDEIIKLEPSAQADSTLAYTDTKGHTHQIPSDIAQKWLETFGLKDLQESYTPKFSEQVAQALEPILQGDSIKLYAGSLIKLIKENRLQYLDRIKPTLEQPQRVILQNDGALIFARDFGGEKYFTSVARNDDGEWIIRSNAPKSESGLDNKIATGGREIYNSQAATQINAHSPYDDIAKSNTKLDSDTIPQKSLMNYALLDNSLVEVIGQKIFHNYDKPYKERMGEIREFFTLPKEHFTKILDKYKREVKSLEKGEIYNKIATTMSIDEITDEITRSLKIKRERGYAAQAEKYFNELEEKAFHISKMLQDMPYQIRDFIQNSAIDYKAAQWQKLLNTLDRLITRNNERILENVQIRHKEYVEKFKNLATRNFSLWKNINALLNKEDIREVGDTLEVRNKNILDSIFKQTTPPSTPTPPTSKGLFDEVDSSEIIFTDKKGKEHTLTKEVQEQWLETFNLKSLDESYTPKLPQELADTLGKEIRLTKGSLYKIVEKGREQYIPQIKETLEKPQIVLQDESELIFAKQIKDDLYLTSIGKDFDTHITIISNSPKTDKTIQNKLKNGKMIYKAENAEALPTSGAFTETNQVPFSNNTIPQKPKNSEPEKVLEYFRDDLIRGYNKALEAFEGKRPLVSTIPYKALDPIIEAKTALVKEANDGFKKILQKAGFPDDVIQEKFMKSLNFGDIDYNLRRIREYFGQVEKNLHQYYETHKPIVEKLLKQKDEAIRLYESRLPAEQELHKKRILLSRFMENARVYGSKEHKLLDNFIDEIEAKKGLLESTQATLAPKKSLFDEVETSVESQATHQDYNTFNQSLKDAHDFFKANNKDPYNDKLFNDVIKVANALDIRFWYQPNAVWMGGSYTYTLNRIMLRSKDFSAENAKTMLHELIHSVTSRAIYAYENKALRAKLSKEQIEAITELKNLYKEVSENNADKVWKKMATFRDEVENNKGKLYGLKNEHEMLAELANPTFREFLKEQNIFSKIVEAMAKIFSYVKDKLTGESVKSTNAQSELESILYKIMDSYTNPHTFTNEMSEHFGSRNFVDTTRYKEYIKDHKEKFDKDNYKGKHLFSFFDNSMNFYTKTAISGRETFFKGFINNAYFDDKDFDIVQKIKWQMMDPYKRPTNFMELKTEKNAHIFQYIEQAQENNIKDFVKEYYGVSYEEFNNAFNGAMKDKHFYEAKQFTYKNYEDIPSKETAFLLALKPYFTSGLYKTLSEADFNVIKDNLYRILQDENLTYRNKPINEWLAKEWVEQDVKALQESFLYKLEQPPLQATQNALESTQKAQGQTKEIQQTLQSTIQTYLEKLPPSPTPQPINEAKIKALIKRFDNVENLQEHLNTRADTQARQQIFSLLNDTLRTPQVHYKKGGKDKYLKRYKSERKEPYFYLLVTKDGDKTFITHFKTRDSRYLSREITKAQEIIQGAGIIEALSQRTGDI